MIPKGKDRGIFILFFTKIHVRVLILVFFAKIQKEKID